MNFIRLVCFSFILTCLNVVIVECAVEGSFRERAKKYCRLAKQCKLREERNYDYKKLIKIDDIPGIKPNGYLVRLPVYILAARDAHIVFSAKESPNWTRDYVYEILLGGWANNRTLIRRRKQDYDLITEQTFNLLRRDDPLKFLFEIKTDGEIKIFIENRDEPLATYKDQNLIQVKYFGFASYDNYLAKFFYNCAGENTYSSNEIENSCRFYESWENEYKEFFKITDIPRIRPEGYLIKFPVYIQATKDAHVLLSPRAADDRADDVYEILIGGWANERIIIRRKQGANVIRDTQTLDVLSMDKPILFLIQLSTDGILKIFGKDGLQPFKLLAEVNDPEPLPIEYISFGSYNTNQVKFYFNCTFDVGVSPDTVSTGTEHPLLASDVPSYIDLRNLLVTRCLYYTNSDYDYKQFIKLTDLKGVTPEGYLVRMVFYIQGARDGHILFSVTDRPNYDRDFVYEFVIGGWGNTRLIIRKKKFGNVLNEAFESNVINSVKPTKILIEIANSGAIRLYSENLKSRPLIETFESNPLPIQYVSFASFENSENQFFYNCSHIDSSKIRRN